jgi:hypothetical protein
MNDYSTTTLAAARFEAYRTACFPGNNGTDPPLTASPARSSG